MALGGQDKEVDKENKIMNHRQADLHDHEEVFYVALEVLLITSCQ